MNLTMDVLRLKPGVSWAELQEQKDIHKPPTEPHQPPQDPPNPPLPDTISASEYQHGYPPPQTPQKPQQGP